VATAEATFGGPRIRARLEAARGRIRAVKRVDRVAGGLIRLGGLGIVVSVLGILVFILSEAWPLFRPARGGLAGTLALPAAIPGPADAVWPPPRPSAAPAAVPAAPGVVQAMGADEYQMYLYVVRAQPRIEFVRLPDGPWTRDFPLPGLAGATKLYTLTNLHPDGTKMYSANF
jgi:hypothetical protein